MCDGVLWDPQREPTPDKLFFDLCNKSLEIMKLLVELRQYINTVDKKWKHNFT